MVQVLEIALVNAALATGLALLAALVGRLLRRPRLTHALWVLVLLKFVTVPLVEVPIGINLQLADLLAPATGPSSGSSKAASHVASPRRQPAGLHPEANASGSLQADVSGLPASRRRQPTGAHPEANASGALQTDVSGSPASIRPRAPRPWRARVIIVRSLLGFWLAGSLLWFGLQLVRTVRFHRSLRLARPADPLLRRRTDQVAWRMGIRKCPAVWLVSGTVSPMLWAIGSRARLLFPEELAERLDKESMATLLAHELAHYRRGDHWVRLLELLVCGLFWWHPVVWWARRQIEEAEEACCDEWVVADVSATPRHYAEALLDTVDFLSEPGPRVPAAASGLGHAQSIRRRLTGIMTRSADSRLPAAGRLPVVLSALTLLPLYPEFTGSGSEPLQAASYRSPASGGRQPAGAYPASRRREPAGAHPEAYASGSPSSEADEIGAPNPAPPQPGRIPPHETWASARSPDGESVITAVTDRSVRFENRRTGQVVDLSEYAITGVAFSPVDRVFVTGGRDGALRFWNGETSEQLAVVKGHEGIVRSVDYAPDGRTLVSAGSDGSVRLWTIAENAPDADSPRELRQRFTEPVNCVRFAPDGTLLAVAVGSWVENAPGRLELWDVETRSRFESFSIASPIGVVAFRDDGETLLAGHWDGGVTFWDAASGRRLSTGRAEKSLIPAAAFSADSGALSAIQPEEPPERVTPVLPQFFGVPWGG